MGENTGVADDGEDVSGEEQAVEIPEGGEIVEVVQADGSVRKERSLLAGLAGAVFGGHVGKKLGLGAGLAIGLGAKKIALKKKEKKVHVKHVQHHHHKPHYKT